MTSAARQFGELTRRGAGAAWKAVRSRKAMAIVSSALRQVWMIKPSGTAAASKTVGRAGARWGSRPQSSAKLLRGGVVEHGSFIRSRAGAAPAIATKIADVAQLQSLWLPTRRCRTVTGRSLQFLEKEPIMAEHRGFVIT